MKAQERRDQLRAVALKLGKKLGYKAINRDHIAKEAKIASSLVPFYFGTIDQMRNQILEDGCESGEARIILEGVINNEPVALKALEKYKKEIMIYLFG